MTIQSGREREVTSVARPGTTRGPRADISGRVVIHDDACTQFHPAIELVGKRWSSSILLAVAQGATRFGEIRAAVPGLSDRLLAERAKELQRAHLLERTVVPTTPVQIRYHLTERGDELIRALQPLVSWGLKWQQPVVEATG